MNKIVPNLWFDDKAEEAANFYVSVFGNGKVGDKIYYDKASAEVSGKPEGSVLAVEFELFGQKFIALNGGPAFKFTEAISLMVNCDTQEEIDRLWEKLTARGGQESVCGWLKDKYGVSWQITPRVWEEMILGKDKKKSERAMKAMLRMKKLVIAELEKAYRGGEEGV